MDPVLISVATALATRAADAAADGVKSAWGAVARRVRARLGDDSQAAAVLAAAESAPQDEARIHELATALERMGAADPDFRDWLRSQWPQAWAELSARDGSVLNSSTGSVGGHLIQARDLRIEGGLNLGDVSR